MGPSVRTAILTVILACLLIALPASQQATPPAPLPETRQIVDEVSPSVVIVTHRTGKDSVYICTGIVVDAVKQNVLTARHCVVDDKDRLVPVMVEFEPSTIIKADSGATKEGRNFGLVLLHVPSLHRPALPIRIARVSMGDPTYAMGFGYGYPTIMLRNILWIFAGDYPQEQFAVDGVFINGMSGGPVVDVNGELIGIIQRAGNDIGYASGPGKIKAFIQ